LVVGNPLDNYERILDLAVSNPDHPKGGSGFVTIMVWERD